MSRRKKRPPATPVETTINSLSHEGRGVARINGKTTFIDGALPGERVMFRYIRGHARFDEGIVVEVLKPSSLRIEPKCKHFLQCGGCSLQHLSPADQIGHKQGVLLEQLRHIGAVEPEAILPPLTGITWGYRRKARLAVKHVVKKGKVLVGFREKHGGFVADISRCVVLHPAVGERITELQQLIGGLTIKNQIPQIEIAVGDQNAVLVFRHLREPSQDDLHKLADFQAATGLSVCLQPGGLDSVAPLNASTDTKLSYRLQDFGLEMHFLPTDFTQVNFDINQPMVKRVIDLLAPTNEESVLDLFCGLGNFSLPLAKYAASVTAVEVSADLIERARRNAKSNGIANVEFHACDLMQAALEASFLRRHYDKILLDPPRSGAEQAVRHMDLNKASRLVYVSCNPATLARDAGILVNEKGFKLKQAGVMDMFPHTSHVESIALFEY